MPEWYEEWIRRRDEVKTANKKTIRKAASAQAKSVNALADAVHSSVFNRIDCLQCANCCKSIPPLVNETDVRRIARHLGIKPSEFKDRFVTTDDDGDLVINDSPCPFLLPDNKCSIYEIRPRACRQYPHTDNFEFSKHLKLHLRNVRYCPAVFHILLEMDKAL